MYRIFEELIKVKELKKERKEIYKEILGIYKELNSYLDYCLNRVSCCCSPRDKVAIKLVDRLEALVDRLDYINYKLELLGEL